MALVIKRKTPAPEAPVTPSVQLTAPDLPAPKVVVKLGPKPLPLPLQAKAQAQEPAEALSPRQQQKLVDSGLMEPEDTKWEPCPVGTRVKITNTMFPWVKHWKPGDLALVTRISHINSSTDDKTGKYLSHILLIDQPLEAGRKGQTAMLFRWEFEPVPTKVEA